MRLDLLQGVVQALVRGLVLRAVEQMEALPSEERPTFASELARGLARAAREIASAASKEDNR